MARRASRGFTLVELMISVAIVGVLSTVAMPGYQNMTLRTRKSERDVVMTSAKRSISAILIRDGRLGLPPETEGGAPRPFVGAWNPDESPSTHRRMLMVSPTDGWKYLDLGVEGGVYHSYSFGPLGSSPTAFTITAKGDLDGDGNAQFKTETYELREGALITSPDYPTSFVPEGDVAF